MALEAIGSLQETGELKGAFQLQARGESAGRMLETQTSLALKSSVKMTPPLLVSLEAFEIHLVNFGYCPCVQEASFELSFVLDMEGVWLGVTSLERLRVRYIEFCSFSSTVRRACSCCSVSPSIIVRSRLRLLRLRPSSATLRRARSRRFSARTFTSLTVGLRCC